MKRKARRLQYAGVIVLLLFAVLYTKEEITLAGNESSRFGVSQALGEQGVFHIERTNFASTVDRVEWNGHVYSDKPLPLSSAAAVVHGTVHRLTGINFSENRMLAIYLINLLFSGGCNILLFLWMFRLLRRTCRGRIEVKWLLALAMCLSTWLLTYSVIFNNHTPAALAVLGLVIALEKYRRRPTLRAAACAAAAAGNRARESRTAAPAAGADGFRCRRRECRRNRAAESYRVRNDPAALYCRGVVRAAAALGDDAGLLV